MHAERGITFACALIRSAHLRARGPILVALALALVGATLGAAAGGGIEIAHGDLATGPAWRRTCLWRHPRVDRQLLERCARVRGRVVYVHRSANESHVAVAAALHLVLVKIENPAIAPPALGSMAVVVGPIVRSRNGLRELEAFDVGRS